MNLGSRFAYIMAWGGSESEAVYGGTTSRSPRLD